MSKSKKRIIITGSSGFIGSALVEKLHKDYEIIGIDRRAPPSHISKLKDCVFHIVDIAELYKITDIMFGGDDIYAVIHLAANPGVRDSHENFENVCKDNIFCTQKIIDLCIHEWKPKKLLLASSSSVYGNSGKYGQTLYETADLRPRSPYAMSKVAGEVLVETYKNCGMLDGIEVASMRFFTVIGPNQRNELAIRAFTDHMLRDEPIDLYGTGKQVRDFTSIDDICDGILALLTAHQLSYDVYNIGSGDTQSIIDIIYKIAKYLNKPVTINYKPRIIWDADATKADITRIGEDTGWHPKKTFDKALKEQIEWQKFMYQGEKLGKSARKLDKVMKENEINRPTPVLKGKAAKRFYQEINQGEISEKQKKYIKKCKKLLKGMP